jgi:hypothetical protein
MEAFDISAQGGGANFLLQGIICWTLHDFLGYGVITSLQTQGFKACPPCGLDVLEATKLQALNKVIYTGYQKYLPYGSKY